MHHNLCLYHKVLAQLKQWLPDERITRLRNMALVMTGLYASMSIHLSKIVSEWPLGGQLVSLTNRLRRWLSNRDIQVRDWYRPMAQQLVAALAQEPIRLVMDVTKVGAQTRMLMMDWPIASASCRWAGGFCAAGKGTPRSKSKSICCVRLARCCLPGSRSG